METGKPYRVRAADSQLASLFPDEAGTGAGAHGATARGEFPETLVPSAWATLTRRLKDPVQVTERGGLRMVEVLRCFRYFVMPTVRWVHFAHGAGGGRFEAGPPGSSAFVDPVMQGDAWLAFFMADWIVTRGADPGPRGIEALAGRIRRGHAFRLLWDRVEACAIVYPLQDRVSEALALDPKVLAWTRLGIPRSLARAVRTRDFTAIWRRAEDLETIERDCPALLRPYAGAVIADALGRHAEPVRDLKLAFRAAGIGEAGWKLLLQANPEDMRMPLIFTRNDNALDVYAWSIQACLTAGRLLPGAVLARLIKPNGHEPGVAEFADASILEEGFWPPFLRALGRRLESVDARTGMRCFLDTEFEDVYDWLESERPDIDANQARAGWAWMLRQHHQWIARQEALALARRGQMRWRVPVREAFVAGHRVVALADAYELWEEGRAMRHCARTWAARCLEGEDLVISIREAQDRRLATAHVGLLRGTWVAGVVRLAGNRIATRPLPQVAAAFAALLNARRP